MTLQDNRTILIEERLVLQVDMQMVKLTTQFLFSQMIMAREPQMGLWLTPILWVPPLLPSQARILILLDSTSFHNWSMARVITTQPLYMMALVLILACQHLQQVRVLSHLFTQIRLVQHKVGMPLTRRDVAMMKKPTKAQSASWLRIIRRQRTEHMLKSSQSWMNDDKCLFTCRDFEMQKQENLTILMFYIF
jgi:alkylated DNA nucleotide flippase Atl1